ncbi:MAG: PKD domain-containing protein [Thermoplasmata archaeon]|nr:PKD domain-containing protein [Thermoplasmata archaeon]
MKFSTSTLALSLVLLVALGTLLVGVLPRGSGSSSPASLPTSPDAAHPLPAASTGIFRSHVAPTSGESSLVSRPHAPTLTTAGDAPAAVGLSWSATNDIFYANYTVFGSSAGPSGPWSFFGVVTPQTATSFSTGSLSPGATYWWQVLEYNSFGGSSGSNVVAQTQPTLAYLTFTKPTSSSADFNWTNNATYGGAVGFVTYSLYEEKNGSAPLLVATVVNPSTRTFTVTGLAGGVGYSFYLNTTECYVACGQGGQQLSTTESNPVTFGTTFTLGASLSATRTVIDTGESDLFTCNPSGGVAPFNYTWTFGAGSPTPGPGSESRSFPSAGPASVNCEVTDSTSAHANAATTISVNAAPTLTLTTNRTTADVGEGITFGCVPHQGTPPFATGWSFGDGSPNGSASAIHSYTSSGRFSATCSAVDATDTQTATSLSLAISPALGVSATVSSAVAAPGTPLQFRALVRNGSGTFPTLTWSFGDGNVGPTNKANATHAYLGPGAFTATFRVTDSNGITVSTTVPLQIRALTVTVLPLSASTTTGSSMLFNATASGGAGAPYNYTWTFGDGKVGYGANLHHAYASAGTYHPTVLVRDPLGATNSSALPALSVTVPPPPQPLLSALGLLAVAFLIGLLLALVAFSRLKRTQSEELQSKAPWVPQTDPSRTVKGVKICRSCGTANLPIRSTCQACGADLPRWAQRGS